MLVRLSRDPLVLIRLSRDPFLVPNRFQAYRPGRGDSGHKVREKTLKERLVLVLRAAQHDEIQRSLARISKVENKLNTYLKEGRAGVRFIYNEFIS